MYIPEHSIEQAQTGCKLQSTGYGTVFYTSKQASKRTPLKRHEETEK